jgi:hypothetical protein
MGCSLHQHGHTHGGGGGHGHSHEAGSQHGHTHGDSNELESQVRGRFFYIFLLFYISQTSPKQKGPIQRL